MEYPLVKAILAEFKGAKIESLVRKIQEEDEDEISSFGSPNRDNNDNDLIFDED